MWFIIFMFVCGLAFGESYLVIDSDKNVRSLSPRQDCVLQGNWTEIILDEDFRDIKLNHAPTDYKYIDNRFVTNHEKLDAEYQMKVANEERQAELEMIEQKARALAITELKKENKVFKHYDDSGKAKD